MTFLGVIPARYASTRFPGKPLTMINGKTMIRRVYEQCLNTTILDGTVVATDDERIESEVASFGGKVVMTASHHSSGTSRCNEVVDILARAGKNFDVVINIQGDEPFIDPKQIELVASCFDDENVKIATLIKKITSHDDLFDHNTVKVVKDTNGFALLFSRQAIPFIRNVNKEKWLDSHIFYKHIGIYAYRLETLKLITELPPSPLEKAESLEQMRWLENGFKIMTKETTLETISIDTPDDLKKIKNHGTLL